MQDPIHTEAHQRFSESAAACETVVPPQTLIGEVVPLVIRNSAWWLTKACHGAAAQSGWWSDLATGASKVSEYPVKHVNVGEKLMLIVSEIGEAMEGDRKTKPNAVRMDDHLPHRSSLEVELADAVIRIFDLSGGLQLDIAGAIVEKLQYNARRADHKVENRQAAGGKAY